MMKTRVARTAPLVENKCQYLLMQKEFTYEEPIGFQGTKAEWTLSPGAYTLMVYASDPFGSAVADCGNDTLPFAEKHADAQLILQSKEMAKALQKLESYVRTNCADRMKTAEGKKVYAKSDILHQLLDDAKAVLLKAIPPVAPSPQNNPDE